RGRQSGNPPHAKKGPEAMSVAPPPASKTRPGSSADGVTWNLADLYDAVDDPRIGRDLDTARQRAATFEAAYRGKIDVPGGPDPDLLLAAVRELESLSEQRDRPAVSAGLPHHSTPAHPRPRALLGRPREQGIITNTHLFFFALEWIRGAAAAPPRFGAAPARAKYRHYLEQKRAWKPHYLSEPEEKVLD